MQVQCVSAERLGKLWRISEEDARNGTDDAAGQALIQHYFVDRVSPQQIIVHYATNVLSFYTDATLRPQVQVLTCTLVKVDVSEKGFIYVRLMK